jgi:hypothetical protein
MAANLSCPGSAGAGCSAWSAVCLNILQAAGNPPVGLVDQYGSPMPTLNNQTWGITYDRCNQMCNTTAIPLVRYLFYYSDQVLIADRAPIGTLRLFRGP